MEREVVSWGTWEELLLGGAVLRHGTRNWDLVSSELQTRTVSPYDFTPEICKVKYEELQERYSGCIALFDELRKQRMAELRNALAVSEGSIGSLESKLESLKSDGNDDSRTSHESCHATSPIAYEKFNRVDLHCKETSKDGLSASSYTQENTPHLSRECQIPASDSLEDFEVHQECAVSPDHEKVLIMDRRANSVWIGPVVALKKRRGKRKRKDCSKDAMEASIGESKFLGSADVVSATCCKENSAGSSGQITETHGADDDQCRGSTKDESADVREIFDIIAENKCASVFRRRLDSQKRGRYKRMILQHMDFDSIRSMISDRSITSVKEVFRDLLLLANNALVFYSKTTREYKSAFLLRSIVVEKLRQHLKNYISKATITLLSAMPTLNPPLKPHSAQPAVRKTAVKATKLGKHTPRIPTSVERTANAHSPPSAESLAVRKKGSGRPQKGVGRSGTQGADQKATKGRKRSRAK